MRIIPVLDLMGGQVVLGRSGQRDQYRPLQHSVLTDQPQSPVAVVQAFRARLSLSSLYLADLDAIRGGAPDWVTYASLLDSNDNSGCVSVWVDAGLSRATQLADYARRAGTGICWVVGLETLAGPEHLRQMCDEYGGDGIIVSLDLKRELPISTWPAWNRADPMDVAKSLLDLGTRRLIVLDLARVGTEQGPGTEQWIERIRHLDAELQIIAGGGIRDVLQIRRLGDAGADGVLVATCLHNGVVGCRELDRIGAAGR